MPGPISLTDDLGVARRIVELVPSVPTPVWGRDELRSSDMWNSNSLTSWLLERAGVDTERLLPPPGGRAPGWIAGRVVARRETPIERGSRSEDHTRHRGHPSG